MAQTHTVGLRIEAQGAAQVQGAVRSVNQALGGMTPAAQSASAAVVRLGEHLARMGHLAVGAFGVQKLIGMADAVTTLESRLKLVTSSTAQAAAAYQSLFDIAQRSSVSFTELGGTFAVVARAGKSLGESQQSLLQVTEAIGNAMTIGGGSAESMNAALVQLGQGLSSGVLRGEELNSVMEQTPRLAQALADGLGVSLGALRTLGAEGKLTAQSVIQALKSQSEVLQKEVAGATLTVGQSLTQLHNATLAAVGDVDKFTGASSTLAGALSGVAKGVGSVGQALKDNQGTIKAVLGGALGAGAVGGIVSVARALSGAGGVAAAIGVVRGAFLALTAAMAANPIGLALLGIGAVTGAVIASNSKTVAERSTAWIEKEIAHQEQRIASAQRSLDLAGGSKGGKDPMTAQLEERLAAMKAYRQELQSEVWTRQAGPTGAGGGRGSINPPTVGEMRAQQQAATSAWQASIAGVKTATSVQQDYTDKLKASRAAFDQLAQTGLQGSALEQAQAQQLEYESALATERDKALKNLTAGTAQAGAAMAQANKLAVEDVQLSAAAMLGSYEDADAVLSAMRSAGLIGEQEYYQTKIGYLQDEAKIRIQALKDENALLASQAQGKAKSLEAERQIAKNRAEIARIEQQTLTKTTVLTVEAAAKRNQEAQAVEEQVAKLREEVQARELATAGNISQAQALEQLRLARLAEALAQAKSRGASAEEIAAIEREIAARKELLQVMDGDAARLANAKAAEEAAKDWERTSKTIGDTLADYIIGGGKNAAQYLKRLFSTLVLQPVVQMVVGGVFGLGGNTAMAGQVGQLGQLGTLASGFNNLVNAFGKGAAGAASSVIGKAVPWLYDAGFKSVAQGLGAFQAGMASQQSIAAFTSALKQGGAQMAGAIAGAVMNGFAGYGISKLISGGYEVNKYVNKIAGVASAIPGVGLIAGVIGGAINRLFGRKLKDTGIEGTFGGEAGFVGNTYEYYKGGLFRSDKTKRNPLDEATRKEFADYYASMVVGTQSLGSVLGLDSSRLDSFTSQIKLSLKGLKPEEQEAKIAEEFGRIQNELAQQVIGTMVTQASKTEAGALYAQWTASGLANRLYSDRSIDNPTAHLDDVDRQLLEKVSGFLNISTSGGSAFLGSQIGSRLAQQAAAPDAYIPSEYALADEKAIDTLTRLATSLTTVNSVLEELNHTLYAGSLAGADTAYKLSELFGGMEGFTAATSSFYENFFTADEQRSKLQAKLSEAFSAVDLTLPDIDASNAREQYRALAEAQDLATESGRAAWAVIMQLGEAFASITPSMEDAQKALADIAQKALADAQKDLDKAVARSEATADHAWRTFKAAIDRDKQYWQGIASASQEAINTIAGSLSLLSSNARQLYGTVDSTQQMLAAQGMVYVESALAGVRAGSSIADFTGLQDAITAARTGISGGVYATEFERQRDVLVLAGQLSQLGDLGDAQLSVEEMALKAAQEQIEQLDATLEYWQQQLDGTAQLIDGNLSINAAVNALAAAIAARDTAKNAASGGGGGSASGGGGGSASGITDNSTLKKVGDAWAAGDWITAQNIIRGQGITNQQLQDAFDLSYADIRYLYNTGITGQNPGQYSFRADTAEGVYAEAKAQGLTLGEVNSLLNVPAGTAEEWAKKMGLPVYHSGTNYVPETGFALLERGEAVLPRAFNPFAGGASRQSSTAEVVAQLRALCEQNARLEARLAGIEKSTEQFAQQFDNVSAGGNELPVFLVNQTISAKVVA